MKVYNDPRQHTMVVGGKLQGKWRVRKVEIVTSGPNWVRIEQNWGVFAPGEKVAKVLFANWRAAYDEAITRAGGAPNGYYTWRGKFRIPVWNPSHPFWEVSQ